jgi:hypothetical protein
MKLINIFSGNSSKLPVASATLVKEDGFKPEIILLNASVLLFLFRMAIPFFKYPFLIFYALFIFFTVFKYRSSLVKSILPFFKAYRLPLSLLLIIIIQFALSNKIYLIVFKEVVSTFILFTFFFFFKIIIDSKVRMDFFFKNFMDQLIVFAILTSCFTFFVQFDIFSFYDLAPRNLTTVFAQKESIDIDNNFSLLPAFFGMISIFYSSVNLMSLRRRIIYVLLLSFFSMNVLLSASKRGLICLLIIISVLIIVKVVTGLKLFKKGTLLTGLNSAANIFLMSLVFLAVFSSSLLFLTSYRFKNRSLEILGNKNVPAALNRVTKNLFEYIQVFRDDASYSGLYKKMWRPDIDPKDPESGWGTRNHKTIEKLSGVNVEIVPEGSKGYMLDKTCNADSKEGNAYAYTLIWNENINKDSVTGATVYCFVSEDYDGKYAMMAYEGVGSEYSRASYDLSKKGIWQELSLKFNYKKGEAPVYLYIAKFGVTDFSSLKGYVIFACPHFNVSSGNDTYIDNVGLNGYPKSASHVSTHRLTLGPGSGEVNRVNEASLISIPLINLESIFTSQLHSQSSDTIKDYDADPIRSWVMKFVSEDSTYSDLKSPIKLDSIRNNFISMRMVHWHFGWQVFSNEYNLTRKLFGGGFRFLNWYGFYFIKDKTASDWPHNPFLSVLLYSGIFGLIIYLLILMKAIQNYILCIKKYSALFLFFLITFFFSFFSGSSPFDPPVMGFFFLLPFFIRDFIKKI